MEPVLAFQNEMAALLETLKKQLRKLNKTKEQWEETRTYIQVHFSEQRFSGIHSWHSLITNPRVSFIRLCVPPQNQAAENEKAIREEFDKLRKFLVEEEQHRLKVLRQEEEVKKQVMSEKLKTLTEGIQNLSANVADIEMALKEKDLPFLMVLVLLTGPLLTWDLLLCFKGCSFSLFFL